MDELQFSNLNQLKGNDILTVQNLTKQTSFAEVFQQSNQSIEKGRLIEYLKRELKSKKANSLQGVDKLSFLKKTKNYI